VCYKDYEELDGEHSTAQLQDPYICTHPCITGLTPLVVCTSGLTPPPHTHTPHHPHRHTPAGHFQADHHPCPHPACLERKFVVFAEEQDLRRHFATEHGSEMNMSRAQRRQVSSPSRPRAVRAGLWLGRALKRPAETCMPAVLSELKRPPVHLNWMCDLPGQLAGLWKHWLRDACSRNNLN
jgi:hypothetical protein